MPNHNREDASGKFLRSVRWLGLAEGDGLYAKEIQKLTTEIANDTKFTAMQYYAMTTLVEKVAFRCFDLDGKSTMTQQFNLVHDRLTTKPAGEKEFVPTVLDLKSYGDTLTAACEVYDKVAPTVTAHCEELYARINERLSKVALYELLTVQRLWTDPDSNIPPWMPPNLAANTIYKLRHELGMDTTGHAGF